MHENMSNSKHDFLPISLSNISLQKRNTYLLNNISAKIENLGITVVLGPNGSGKSLLIKVMHGLILPTKGEVRFNGHKLTPQHRKQQAFVFQNPTLLRRSVIENLRFVDKIFRNVGAQQCLEILKLVGLEKLSDLPAGLLSGGEKQCLALARALLTKPRIPFLDEPTANLDLKSIEKIEKLVKNQSGEGTKIIFITHDLAQAKRLANDVIFLHKGQIKERAKSPIFFTQPKSKLVIDFLDGKILT